MSGTLQIGRAEALDLAIGLAKRLGQAADAELLSIDSTPHSTTVRLAIPASGSPGLRTLRRQLWSSYVHRTVARRRRWHTDVRATIVGLRQSAEESARRAAHVRAFLAERATAR